MLSAMMLADSTASSQGSSNDMHRFQQLAGWTPVSSMLSEHYLDRLRETALPAHEDLVSVFHSLA